MPFSVLFSVATSLIVPLGLVAGTLMFMDGQLDAPRLIAAVMIAVSISSMMTTLGVIYPRAELPGQSGGGHPSEYRPNAPLPYRDATPRFTSFDVRFDDVRFGYADGKEVLHGVTFTAQPGTRTALVGPSGSGKTTVISLISRFWDASSGSVRVGGHEVRDIAPDALAEQVAVVFQDVYLLADTWRTTSAWASRMRRRRKWKRPPAPRTATTSSRRCRRATTPWWAKAVPRFPAARSSSISIARALIKERSHRCCWT